MVSVLGEGGTALWGLEAGSSLFLDDLYGSIERGCEEVGPGMGDEDAGCVILLGKVGDDEVDDFLGEGEEGRHFLGRRGGNESCCR